MKRFFLFLLIAALCCPSAVYAQRQKKRAKQKNRFNAGLVFGVNAAQLDGDLHLGYKKFGIEGGLRGSAFLSERLDLSVELLFSQKGAKANQGIGFASPNAVNIRKPINILLNYAETPFLLNYKFRENWDGEYTLQVSAGFSFGRLLGSTVSETVYDVNNEVEVKYTQLQDDFERNSLSAIVGVSWRFIPQMDFSVRHAIGLTRLYKGDKNVPGRPNLRSFHLNFNLGYWF